MIPLALAVGGLLAFAAALVLLGRFGERYRVGRLLAAAPAVSIAEARRLAQAGETRYVRIEGRIDSEAEFEDVDHRPLVLRRTTVEWGRGGETGAGAATVVRGVPFVVREGLDEIGVTAADLGPGLVVMPRLSEGRAGDLWGPESAAEAGAAGTTQLRRVADFPTEPDEVDREAPVLLRIEQVSSVEHATVVGVPTAAPDGAIAMAAGLGRPLILSTLERDEAMRLLGGGAVGRSRAVLVLLAVSGLLLAIALLWWLVAAIGAPESAFAASPDPTIAPGSDTRTPGQNPSFVGAPLVAIGGVLAIAVLTIAATLAYVRLTGGRGPGPRAPRR